jgi:hypothetical protein
MRRVAGERASRRTGLNANAAPPPAPPPSAASSLHHPAPAAAETKTSIGTGADPGLKVNNAQSTNAQAD